MPLHDVGYRAWEGKTTSSGIRWLSIASTGIRIAFRSTWLSRTLILSVVPALAFAIAFLLYEQSIHQPQMREIGANLLMMAGADQAMIQQAMADPESARYQIWSALLLGFFRYPQAIGMLVVVGIVSPKLISYDLRNRGYLLYFSRPIQPWEYVFGKSLIVWLFIVLITTIPALLLYVVGLGLSADIYLISDTWDLPLRILAGTLVLTIPTTSVALACSAMTIESRKAVFAWFAMWIVGWVTYTVLTAGAMAADSRERMRAQREQLRQEVRSVENRDGRIQRRGQRERIPVALTFTSHWELLSPYHILGRVQQWIFGLYPADRSIVPHFAILIGVTIFANAFIYRQLRLRLVA